jgi:hypothetical protein
MESRRVYLKCPGHYLRHYLILNQIKTASIYVENKVFKILKGIFKIPVSSYRDALTRDPILELFN